MKITSIIRKSLAFVALACLATTNADAQTARLFKGSIADYAKTNGVSLVGEKLTSTPQKNHMVTVNPNDFGTPVTLMEEDFSMFATGTEEAPDFQTNVLLDYSMGECEYPWWNVNPEYTHMPKWGGANIFPAGGKVFMLTSNVDGAGHISTPLLDFSQYDGVAFFEFKVKTLNPELNQRLSIEAAETHNMSPEWTVLGAEVSDPLTDEWQTYTVMYNGAGKTTLFNLVAVMDQEWQQSQSTEDSQILFDDFKVFSVEPFVRMPEPLAHSNYKGTEFDVNWKAVEGADSYLVDVFSITQSDPYSPAVREDLVTAAEATTNTYHVTGANSGQLYFFTVTSVKGDKKSITSSPVEICDLVAPEFTAEPTATEMEDGKFIFSTEWTEVPSAEVYDYAVMRSREAWKDGEFVVTNEKFEGLLDGDGNPSVWSEENPQYGSYGFLQIKPLAQAGWTGYNYVPYDGFVVVDGWQAVANHSSSYIVSPELDLSKDNGKVSLSVKLLGKIGGWFDPIKQEQHDNIQVKAAVALYNYNESTKTYEQTEYVRLDDVNTEWNTFNVELTKGTKNSYIVISAIEGPEHLFIDDLLITQNYKKGESLIEPIYYEYWYYNTTIDVELPAECKGQALYEKVSAQKVNPIKKTPIYTNYTTHSIGYAGDHAGIENATIANSLVSCEDGHIVVNNVNGDEVNVYTVDGSLVYSNNSRDAHIVLNLVKNNAYLVKVGSKTVKVVF